MRKKESKTLTSMRLTKVAKRLIVALSKKMGVNKTAVLELAIRELAKKEKIEP